MWLCNHHQIPDVEHFYQPQKVPHGPFQSIVSSYPQTQALQTTHPVSILVVFLSTVSYKQNHVVSVASCVWLLLLSIIL